MVDFSGNVPEWLVNLKNDAKMVLKTLGKIIIAPVKSSEMGVGIGKGVGVDTIIAACKGVTVSASCANKITETYTLDYKGVDLKSSSSTEM